MLRLSVLLGACVALTAAHGSPLRELELSKEASKPAVNRSGKPVGNTPIPINKQFRTLDEYLAYREKRGHIDQAWYRQIKPGIYRLETGNYRPLGGDDQKRIFTRAELMRKYGFTR